MGPKGKSKSEPVVEPVLEGARFATIELGLAEDSCKVLVNLNCRLDIILDACRNHLLKQLVEKINVMKSDHAMGVTIDAAAAETISEKIQKLSEFPSKLQMSQVSDLELQDYSAGTLVSCKSVSGYYFHTSIRFLSELIARYLG
jgi:hypothetical protein